jgi:hypothetical protein
MMVEALPRTRLKQRVALGKLQIVGTLPRKHP